MHQMHPASINSVGNQNSGTGMARAIPHRKHISERIRRMRKHGVLQFNVRSSPQLQTIHSSPRVQAHSHMRTIFALL
jgi:hypothetical protein